MVTARKAWAGVMHCSGPNEAPFTVWRLTAAQTSSNGVIGTTGVSQWMV